MHVLCIGFHMNKTSNPIYMVVNRSIINSRSSRKREWDTMTCWACFSIQTQPRGSSKFHLPNQLPIVMKRENLMQPSYLRGYMSMATLMVIQLTWRSWPHRVKPKAEGKVKSGQLNRLFQAEKGRKGTPLNPWPRQYGVLLTWGTVGGKSPPTLETLVWGWLWVNYSSYNSSQPAH